MSRKLELFSNYEAESLLEYYFRQATPGMFIMAPNGNVGFMLENKRDVIINKDGSVTWKVKEISLGLHSFIQLTTGETKKKQLYIPLCLVNPKSRLYIKFLLETTRDLLDGRYNGKGAELYILTRNGDGFKINVRLENLAMHYVMLQLFPSDFLLKWKSQYCPFCRELGGVE